MSFLYLMPESELTGERKKTIDNIVEQLKTKYEIPPCTKEKLLKIAEDREINVHYFDWISVPRCFSDDSGSYIVLPSRRFLKHGFRLNMSHELGHIILDTSDESEVGYFTVRLLGHLGYIKEGISSVYALLKDDKEIKKLKGDLPRIKNEIESLIKNKTLPEILLHDLIKDDYQKFVEPQLIRDNNLYK